MPLDRSRENQEDSEELEPYLNKKVEKMGGTTMVNGKMKLRNNNAHDEGFVGLAGIALCSLLFARALK
jgi:hypothetical protein